VKGEVMAERGAAGIDLDLGAPALDLDEPDTFIESRTDYRVD
jgi:hypothetical protein